MPDTTPYLPQTPRPSLPARVIVTGSIIALIAAGLLIWWVVTVLASNSPWSEYVEPGRADTMAEQIQENGPAFLADLAGRQHDLYVFHTGTDHNEGWTAIGVFVPDLDNCIVEWDISAEQLTGSTLDEYSGDPAQCTDLSFSKDGEGLVHYRIWSEENHLKIDINSGDIS